MKEIVWNADRPRQAFELALLGHTDKDIAKVMGVSVETMDYWKRTKPSFKRTLQNGKDVADAKVAHALYKRAVGYSHPDVHISNFKGEITITPITKHYPPDTDAAKSWLALRQKDKWSQRQQIDVTNTNINITKIDIADFSKEELMLVKKMGMKQLMENNTPSKS